jgi:hypothetical protein
MLLNCGSQALETIYGNDGKGKKRAGILGDGDIRDEKALLQQGLISQWDCHQTPILPPLC